MAKRRRRGKAAAKNNEGNTKKATASEENDNSLTFETEGLEVDNSYKEVYSLLMDNNAEQENLPIRIKEEPIDSFTHTVTDPTASLNRHDPTASLNRNDPTASFNSHDPTASLNRHDPTASLNRHDTAVPLIPASAIKKEPDESLRKETTDRGFPSEVLNSNTGHAETIPFFESLANSAEREAIESATISNQLCSTKTVSNTSDLSKEVTVKSEPQPLSPVEAVILDQTEKNIEVIDIADDDDEEEEEIPPIKQPQMSKIINPIVKQEPASNEEEPATNVEKPASHAEKPAPSVEKPAPSIEKSASSIEKPASNIEKPASSIEKPASSIEKPAPSIEKSASSIEKSASSIEKPASNVDSENRTLNNFLHIKIKEEPLETEMISAAAQIEQNLSSHTNQHHMDQTEKLDEIQTTVPSFTFADSLKNIGQKWEALQYVQSVDFCDSEQPCLEELDYFLDISDRYTFEENDENWIDHAKFVKKELDKEIEASLKKSKMSMNSLPRMKRLKLAFLKFFNLPHSIEDLEDELVMDSDCNTANNDEHNRFCSLPDDVWSNIMEGVNNLNSTAAETSLSPARSFLMQVPLEHSVDQSSTNFSLLQEVPPVLNITDAIGSSTSFSSAKAGPDTAFAFPESSPANIGSAYQSLFSTDELRSILESTKNVKHDDFSASSEIQGTTTSNNAEIKETNKVVCKGNENSDVVSPFEENGNAENTVDDQTENVTHETIFDDDEDSMDTVINSPSHDSSLAVLSDCTDEEEATTQRNDRKRSPSPKESPIKKKSKFEEVIRRAEERIKLPKQTQRTTLKDPKLDSLRKKLEQKKIKTVSVIQPLPMESMEVKNSKKKSVKKQSKSKLSKSASEEKQDSDDEKSVNKPKQTATEDLNRDPRLNKRPRMESSSDSSKDTSKDSFSFERFQYRGGFLTENIKMPQKKRKPSPLLNKEKKRSLTITELYAAADVPDIVSEGIMNDVVAGETERSKKKINIDDYNKRRNANQNSTSSSYPPQPVRDPRITTHVSGAPATSVGIQAPQPRGSYHGQPFYSGSGHPSTVSNLNNQHFGASQQLPTVKSSPHVPMFYQAPPEGTPSSFSYQQPAYLPPHRKAPLLPTHPPLPKIDDLVPPPPPLPLSSSSPISSPSVSQSPLSDFSSYSTKIISPSFQENLPAVRDHHPTSKLINILPERLKNAIGYRVVSETEMTYIILSYDAAGFTDQKFDADAHPPNCPITKEIKWTYENELEYFNTYMPYMMIDNFQRMLTNFKNNRMHPPNFHFLNIRDMRATGDSIEVRCLSAQKLVYNIQSFPNEGDIVYLRLKVRGSPDVRVFGYVKKSTVAASDAAKREIHEITVKMMFKIENLDIKNQVRALVLHNIHALRKQVQALKFLEASPLRGAVLCPGYEPPEAEKKRGVKYSCNHIVQDRVRHVDKTASAVSKAVQQVMRGLTGDGDHITIVDTPAGTDGLSSIISLIFEVKKMCGDDRSTRILVCTKTVQRLSEIAFRLVAEEDDADNSMNVRLAINMKPEEVHEDLRIYTISQIIAIYKKGKGYSDVNDSQTLENECYEFIFKSCDVILSPVLTCHNKKIHQVIGPKSKKPLTFCIFDEAYSCTEVESIIPLLYGIRKFVLFGDPSAERQKPLLKPRTGCFYRSLAERIKHGLKEQSC